jgi:hypothetical protein
VQNLLQSLEVRAWLEELGLAQYETTLFSDESIDGDVLPDLTDADRVRLDIPLERRKYEVKRKGVKMLAKAAHARRARA